MSPPFGCSLPRLLPAIFPPMLFALLTATYNILISVVSASDVIYDPSHVCYESQSNGYLNWLYTCRPDEFKEVVACGEQKKLINCPKDTYIAVLAASSGRSRTIANCLQNAIPNDRDCSVACVLNEVNPVCFEKRKCNIRVEDVKLSQPCRRRMAQTEHRFLQLLYICATRSVIKDVHNWTNGAPPADNCPNGSEEKTVAFNPHTTHLPRDENTLASDNARETSTLPSITRRSLSPLDISDDNKNSYEGLAEIKEETLGTGTPPSAEAKNTAPVWSPTEVVRVSKVEELGTEEVNAHNGSVSPAPPPPSYTFLYSISEFLWTWGYATGNVEKCVLYLLIGFLLGVVILLLVVILIQLYSARRSNSVDTPAVAPRLTDSSNSVKWRSGESESSTGDDRTDNEEPPSTDHRSARQNGHPRGLENSAPWPANYAPHPNRLPQTQSGNDSDDGLGDRWNNAPASGHPPSPQRATQSLPRSSTPQWDGDGTNSPYTHGAYTLQPPRSYHGDN